MCTTRHHHTLYAIALRPELPGSYAINGLVLPEGLHVELLGVGEIQWYPEEDCTVLEIPENIPKQPAYAFKIYRWE